MGVRSYFIQYKFILPDTIKHSSYTYQKLFRALYGYTQAVYKSNGKVYHYHRNGVLSDTPFLRPGKNCVIIPTPALQKLVDFFKTGRNPTHRWKGKGDWKAVYYMNEKDVDEKKIAEAITALLNRFQISGVSDKPLSLMEAAEYLSSQGATKGKGDLNEILIAQAKPIVDSDWFKAAAPVSKELKGFYSSYKNLREN
ncbi:MAG: hypothetical protein QGI60_02650 [archaeon]|jgi:hypothetical protein|nr:hypothetical protein [archaeon]